MAWLDRLGCNTGQVLRNLVRQCIITVFPTECDLEHGLVIVLDLESLRWPDLRREVDKQPVDKEIVILDSRQTGGRLDLADRDLLVFGQMSLEDNNISILDLRSNERILRLHALDIGLLDFLVQLER